MKKTALVLVIAIALLSTFAITACGQPEFDYGSDYEGSGSYECDISDPYWGTSCDWIWNYWDDDRGDGNPNTFDLYSDYYPENY